MARLAKSDTFQLWPPERSSGNGADRRRTRPDAGGLLRRHGGTRWPDGSERVNRHAHRSARPGGGGSPSGQAPRTRCGCSFTDAARRGSGATAERRSCRSVEGLEEPQGRSALPRQPRPGLRTRWRHRPGEAPRVLRSPGCRTSGQWGAGGNVGPPFAFLRTGGRQRSGLPSTTHSDLAELVEALPFFARWKKRTGLRQAQASRRWGGFVPGAKPPQRPLPTHPRVIDMRRLRGS